MPPHSQSALAEAAAAAASIVAYEKQNGKYATPEHGSDEVPF
jgi:hypothetical protein